MLSADDMYKGNRDPLNIIPGHIYSVTELTQDIKQVLYSTPRFKEIVLQGEISEFKRAASGHIYFRLKDDGSIISCAFLKDQQTGDLSSIEDGLKVRTQGFLSVYEPRGQYQLNIRIITPLGEGTSSINLKRLRDRLEGEGLFDEARKRPIQRLPRKIGVVTSKDSQAINDIRTVVNARFPKMNLVMAYTTLLGNGAPCNIVQAINRLSEMEDIDAIILARGGGPSGEFMPFNDEVLVRTIASSTKPIITGIGHENDVCLADLAADVRASTPSTAAQEAVPDLQKLKNPFMTSLKSRRKYESLARR